MREPRRRAGRSRRRDPARLAALAALRRINGEQAYANLVLGPLVTALNTQDAGFVTELVHGTCRWQGSYDRIIEAAAGRSLGSLQPAVVDVLRLACHQLFGTRTPVHAAVATSVDLAAIAIGEHTTGVVNAIVRRLAARSLDRWLAELTAGLDPLAAMALRYAHPEWIVQAFADTLSGDDAELAELLAADNRPPVPMLAVRPGLGEVAELVTAGAEPARWSPWGASRPGDPEALPAIRAGRAGVQDEGSQLVIRAATRAACPRGPWLDLCAGPGGKSALLRGLSPGLLVAAELHPHRAELVAASLRGYPRTGAGHAGHQVIVADGTRPAWQPGSFALVVVDAPCSGLGALRRRPEARWRDRAGQVKSLARLQTRLLASAISAAMPGGVIAYITCSPHRQETLAVVQSAKGVEILNAPPLLPQVPQAASRLDDRFIQLWPHRHDTDAMFCALLRRGDR